MSNLICLCVVVVTLFIMFILIMDHVEVNRHMRAQNETFLQWKSDYDAALIVASYGTDALFQEIEAEHKYPTPESHANVLKILKTMK